MRSIARIRIGLIITSVALGSAAFGKPNPALTRSTPVPANEPVPIADFFRPLMFRNPQINPAGTHIAAYFSTNEDRIDLIVYDLVTNKPGGISGQATKDISFFQWLDDRRLVFSVSRDKQYAYGLFAADVTDLRSNIAINGYDVTRLIGVPRKHPLKPLVWIMRSAAEDGGDGGVAQFDATQRVKMGVAVVSESKAVQANDGANIIATFPSPKDGRVITYMADGDGELGYAITNKDGTSTLHRWVDKRWVKAFDLRNLVPYTATENPGELLALGRRQKSKPRALVRVDAVTGKVNDETVIQDAVYDFRPQKFHIRESDGRVVGVNWLRDGPQTTWFDAAYREYQATLDRMMPGARMRVIDMDRSGKKLLVHAMSDRHPGRYFIFDTVKPEMITIASAAPWIDPARMRPMRVTTYKARDGAEIESYVTIPDGVSKETPAPLVVLPHGGPWVRDAWGWDAEAQFLASRGYLVLQPNYRGSTGFSWRFAKEDDWDFKKMHEDVTDGVKALIASGMVDPDRIAIMGTSFGAYLALCGAAFEPDLYRCAIGLAGVYDWEQVVREARGDDNFPGRYRSLVRNLGDPKELAAKYETISPVRHVERIKIPIFVAHGRDDRVASVDQSKRLIRELKKHRVAHQTQLEHDEGHGFHHLENQIELYTALETFLGKNLAKRPAPATAGTR